MWHNKRVMYQVRSPLRSWAKKDSDSGLDGLASILMTNQLKSKVAFFFWVDEPG